MTNLDTSLDEKIAQAVHATAHATRFKTGDRFSQLKRITVEADTKAIKALILSEIKELCGRKKPYKGGSFSYHEGYEQFRTHLLEKARKRYE